MLSSPPSTQPSGKDVALDVRNLRIQFHTYAGNVQAIDGMDLEVQKHEILGLVGESGCGKSVTTLAIAGLLPENAEIKTGEILLSGRDLLKLKKNELRQARLSEIALVFQDPMTYLNPVMSIGSQLEEIFTGNLKFCKDDLVSYRLNQIEDELSNNRGNQDELTREKVRLLELRGKSSIKKREARRLVKLRCKDYLKLVGLPQPEQIMKMYPFELSGGMRQRAMIAMALVRNPKVLLADEITTALDVTVQAQVLELITELRDKIDASIILVTHDLGVVAQTCDRVAVMYAGNIVEVASVNGIFSDPLHPYTKGLLSSVPRVDTHKEELASIQGSVPDLIFPPTGCRFHPRCPMAFDKCLREKPQLAEINPGHFVACFLYTQASEENTQAE